MPIPLSQGSHFDRRSEATRRPQLKLRKTELNAFLAETDEPPPLLHPGMAQQYRKRIQPLYETLQDGSEGRRVEAANVIRSLVEDIVLTPVEGQD